MEISKYIIQTELEYESEPVLPGLEMVHVSGGDFLMGSDEKDHSSNERPIHQVFLDDFCIGRTLVTQSQWKRIMGNNPSFWEGDDLPVENININDITLFIEKLNTVSGKKYRLPTEAEWEYAARGGIFSKGYKYSGSNNLDEVAWYNGNSNNQTHVVASRRANELGLYDMSGNVWEWVNDIYETNYYSNSPHRNPSGPSTGSIRSLRGGRFGSPEVRCCVSARSLSDPDIRCNAHGFRLVLDGVPDKKWIIYNTLTHSLIEMSDSDYKKIFINKDFTDKKTIKKLIEQGFIIDSHEDEYHKYEMERDERISKLGNNVTIVPTTGCNAHCFYCFENGIDTTYKMTKETADKTIDFICKRYPDKIIKIFWFGGEPLMGYDIIEYITTRLKEQGFVLDAHVITNLSLLTEDMVVFFRKNYRNLSVEIPIDKIGTELYDLKRFENLSRENAYDTIMSNVDMLMQHNIFVSISINYVPSQIYSIKRIYNELRNRMSCYPQNSYYVFLTPLGIHGTKEMITNFDGPQCHPYIQSVNFRLECENNYDKTFVENTIALLPKKPCEKGTDKVQININADGSLYNCIKLIGRDDFKIGSLDNGLDLWSESLEKQNAIHDPNFKCKDCSILPICQGGCMAKTVLFGQGHECHKILQVQKELLQRYYHELLKLKYVG